MSNKNIKDTVRKKMGWNAAKQFGAPATFESMLKNGILGMFLFIALAMAFEIESSIRHPPIRDLSIIDIIHYFLKDSVEANFDAFLGDWSRLKAALEFIHGCFLPLMPLFIIFPKYAFPRSQ